MKNKKIIDLLDQVIEKSIAEDREKNKEKSFEKRTGESWITFHLKSLKELILKGYE